MIHFIRTFLGRLFRHDKQDNTETEGTKVASKVWPSVPQETAVTDVMVYVSPNAQKYHTQDCQLVQTKTPIKLEEAMNRYEPCKVCNPPAVETT